MRRRRRSPDSLRGLRESRGGHRRVPDGDGPAAAVGARRPAVSRRRAHRGPLRVPTSTTPPFRCGCAHVTVDLERPPPHPAPPASAFGRLQTEPRSGLVFGDEFPCGAGVIRIGLPTRLRRSADPARVRARISPVCSCAGAIASSSCWGSSPGIVERVAPAPVRQRQFGGHPDVLFVDGLAIRARPHARQRCAPPRGRRASRRRRMPRTARRCGVIRRPATPHRRRIRGPRRCGGPGRHPARRTRRRSRPGPPRTPAGPDDVGPHVDVARRPHVDGEPEPVQQLRTQLALFGVHRADQDEPGLVAVRDAVAFDVHPAHRGGVEQHVDEVVVQQVDLVDVQHAAVRARQQTRREGVLAVAQHALQIQRADHPVLGGADGQLDERRIRVDRGKHLRRGHAPPSTSPCPSRRGSARRRSRAAPRTAPVPAAAGRDRRWR